MTIRSHFLSKFIPQSYDYNLVVIGAGSAGLVSAYLAAGLQAKVLLVECEKMGGRLLEYRLRPEQGVDSLS